MELPCLKCNIASRCNLVTDTQKYIKQFHKLPNWFDLKTKYDTDWEEDYKCSYKWRRESEIRNHEMNKGYMNWLPSSCYVKNE